MKLKIREMDQRLFLSVLLQRAQIGNLKPKTENSP